MRRVLMAVAFAMATSQVLAQSPSPKTYVLSETLVNEIYTTLAKDSYSQVATVLAHLQAEVLKQPASIAAPEAPKSEPAK